MSCGNSSANTPHSLIRRAISCEYWPPKSRTSTSSDAAGAPLPCGRSSSTAAFVAVAEASVIRDGDSHGDGGATVRAHPDGLLALELLALGLERRRDHHLRAVER